MADARGEYWYFEDGVDPNKITVPELRSILLRHGATYPSSARKGTLVSLFVDVVLPQKPQVQRMLAQTKRSTRGIVDVPSSSASTADTDETEDETLVAPTPATRRISRRTTRGTTEDVDVPAPRAKTPSRAVPAKHSRALESEVDERPATRRTRKSVTPAVKEPSPDPVAWHRNDAASPFTQENPFQKGASSPAVPDTIARERRRRTTGYGRERRKSDALRRQTYQPSSELQDDGISVPTRRTFDMVDPRVKQEEDEEDERKMSWTQAKNSPQKNSWSWCASAHRQEKWISFLPADGSRKPKLLAGSRQVLGPFFLLRLQSLLGSGGKKKSTLDSVALGAMLQH
ncbi:hypothetical protein P3342_000501 [Pyrenophora teres f. teres]|nr:hypothetical protein P3342_000501 [Pyrenophora teres f. teres]